MTDRSAKPNQKKGKPHLLALTQRRAVMAFVILLVVVLFFQALFEYNDYRRAQAVLRKGLVEKTKGRNQVSGRTGHGFHQLRTGGDVEAITLPVEDQGR